MQFRTANISAKCYYKARTIYRRLHCLTGKHKNTKWKNSCRGLQRVFQNVINMDYYRKFHINVNIHGTGKWKSNINCLRMRILCRLFTYCIPDWFTYCNTYRRDDETLLTSPVPYTVPRSYFPLFLPKLACYFVAKSGRVFCTSSAFANNHLVCIVMIGQLSPRNQLIGAVFHEAS